MRVATTFGSNHDARQGLSSKMATVNAYKSVFLASYGVWLVAMLLSSTFFAASIGVGLLTALRFLGLLGAVLSVFIRSEHKVAELLSFIFLLVLLFVSMRTNAPVLLDLIVFVYCGRFVEFKSLAQESLLITSVVLSLTVFAAEVGFIRNYISFDISGEVMRRREYLGFLYALQPAQLMFNITCLVVYLKREKFTLPCAFALLVANLFIFLKTNARLSFCISVALVILALLLRFKAGKKVLGQSLIAIAPVSFVIAFVVCWLATVAYPGQSSLLYDLNYILGNRLAFGHDALAKYGTTMFGQDIVFVGNGLDFDGELSSASQYNYVDCLYVRLPLLYGWFFTGVFLLGMTFVAIWAKRKRNYCLALILVVIATHCVVDDLIIRLQFCTFLFLLGSIFVEGKFSLFKRRKH